MRAPSSVRTTRGITAGLISGSSLTPIVTKVSPLAEMLGEEKENDAYEAVTFSYHVCHEVDVIGIVVFGFGTAATADLPVVVPMSFP